MDLYDFRTNYLLDKLSRNDLHDNPVQQFQRWFEQILTTDYGDPSAMIAATVDQLGQPTQRYVLLKQFDDSGFVFFTDTSSTKGQQIANNPKVSLLFPWHLLGRQVRIEGVAERLDSAIAETYFHSRPLESQLAASCSYQSKPIASRIELEKNYAAMVEQNQGKKQIDLPERWGGYRVVPTVFEFWQGGENRLHDRFCYEKQSDKWSIKRLQP